MNTNISIELQSHFLRLYEIACSNKNFDVLEMKLLYKFAEQRGVNSEQLNNILTNPAHQMEIPTEIAKRIEYLYDLAIMIWADKEVNNDEYNLLRKYCETFEFLPENINSICDYLIDCAKNETEIQEILDSIN